MAARWNCGDATITGHTFCSPNAQRNPIFVPLQVLLIFPHERHQEQVGVLANAVDDSSGEYRFSIEFFIFQDSGEYVAYCPMFDISTCVVAYNDAMNAFYEMFQLYVECCVDKARLMAVSNMAKLINLKAVHNRSFFK